MITIAIATLQGLPRTRRTLTLSNGEVIWDLSGNGRPQHLSLVNNLGLRANQPMLGKNTRMDRLTGTDFPQMLDRVTVRRQHQAGILRRV